MTPFDLEGGRAVVINSFSIVERRMSINSTGKNKSVAPVNIFRIILFKIEFNKFYVIFQIIGCEPIPIILKICLCKTDANFFLHELKRFAVQISEIFAAYGFWIIGMGEVSDSQIRQRFNVFLSYADITELVRYVYF